MSIQIDQIAPDFTLVNTDKQNITLSELKGKNVVILFFPFAFTSVCTAELCDVRDNYHAYQSLNAEILAISVDSVFTLEKWRNEMNYPFPLLSDFNKEVSTAYDCIYDQFAFGTRGVSKRAAFVINTDGVVKYAEVLENAGEMPNLEAIRTCLSNI